VAILKQGIDIRKTWENKDLRAFVFQSLKNPTNELPCLSLKDENERLSTTMQENLHNLLLKNSVHSKPLGFWRDDDIEDNQFGMLDDLKQVSKIDAIQPNLL